MSIHTERTFEAAIEEELLQNGGFIKGHSTDFNSELGLFPTHVFAFLRESQPKEWEKTSTIHKADVEQKVLARLLKELDLRGTLDVARFSCFHQMEVVRKRIADAREFGAKLREMQTRLKQ